MNDNTPNFELPQPQTPEQQAANPNVNELVIGVPSPESKTQSSGGPAPQQPDPAAAATAASDAAQVGIVPIADPAATTPAGVAVPPPQAAQDADVIEKEWVDRAKKVVEQTRHDPHEQNKQLNIYKADYMQKRFKKDIKVANN